MTEDAQKNKEDENPSLVATNESGKRIEDEDWYQKLTSKAKGRVTSKSQVRDKDKLSNKGYFALLRRRIFNSKKLQVKLKNAADAIKKQIQDSKAKIKKVIQALQKGKPYKATVVAIGYAKELVKFLKDSKGMAVNHMRNMQSIDRSGKKASYVTLVGVRYKEPKKINLEVKVKEKPKDKGKDKDKEKDQGKDQQISENQQQQQQAAAEKVTAQNVSEVKADKKEQKKQAEVKAEKKQQAAEKNGIAAPVNVKQKEVARGVSSSVSAAQQERQEGVQTKTEKVKPRLGLSREAEKQLMKEERRQEKEFKKLAEENDKGITAERTVKGKEKQQEEKTPEKQRQAGEVKKAADQLRHAEMAKKIDQLREKLNDLHQKRNEHMMSLGKSASEQVVKMTPEEVKELPSMKAEAAMNKAEASLDLPKAERGGLVSEASLKNMEKMTEKAEAGLNKATFVPDYATKEFKQKAEEQGIPLTQTGAQVEKESVKDQKTLDRQKIMTLSGRGPEAVSNEQPLHGQQNQNETENQTDQQNEKQQLRIDPEKSRKMSAEKSGKQISMQKYQMMKQVRGGRAAG